MTGTGVRSIRPLLAMAFGFDALQYGFGIGSVAAVAADHGDALAPALVPLQGPWRWVLVALIWLCCGLFARGRRPAVTALVALAAMAALSATHLGLFGSPWRHLFHSGGCLLGWTAGWLWAQWRGAAAQEREAAASWGALGVLGAAYTSAGLSKLLFGGWGWSDGLSLQAALLGQMGDASHGWRGAARAWVLAHPMAISLLTWGTLIAEVGGLALLGPVWLRRSFAVSLAAMHATIFALTDIGYFTSIFLLLTVGWRGPLAAELPALTQAQPRAAWRAWGLAGLLLIATAGGMARQRQRFADRAAVGDSQPAAAPLANLDEAKSLGPFDVGALWQGWQVAGFAPRADGVGVRLRRGDQQAMLWLLCGSGQPAVGNAHMTGDWPLSSGEVALLASQLQTTLQHRREASDACAAFAQWTYTAAEAGRVPAPASCECPGH